MDQFFYAPDSSATAWATAVPRRPGFVGTVSFYVGASDVSGPVVHECLNIRATRGEAFSDACADAKKLVEMWADQVPIDDVFGPPQATI